MRMIQIPLRLTEDQWQTLYDRVEGTDVHDVVETKLQEAEICGMRDSPSTSTTTTKAAKATKKSRSSLTHSPTVRRARG